MMSSKAAVLDSQRVVMIRYQVDGQSRIGSGLRINGGQVLTADHCAEGSAHQVLPMGASGPGLPADVLVRSEDLAIDLAVLVTPDAAKISPLDFVRVDRTTANVLEGCVAIGFPRWKKVGDQRQSAQVDGYIPTLEGLHPADSGSAIALLSLKVTGPSIASAPVIPSGSLETATSQWAGISGAVVLTQKIQVVGVIRSHNPPEGVGSLTVTPIDAIFGLPDVMQQEFWSALKIAPPQNFPYVQLPSARSSTPSSAEKIGTMLLQANSVWDTEVRSAILADVWGRHPARFGVSRSNNAVVDIGNIVRACEEYGVLTDLVDAASKYAPPAVQASLTELLSDRASG